MTVETEEAAPAGTDAAAATPRARWDASDVSMRLVVVMLVITAVIAVLGWQYRPGTGAYPTVSRRLALWVNADAHSLVLTLARTGSDGAVLTLYDDDAAEVEASPHGETAGGWTIGIDGLGTGRVVRDPGPGEVPIPVGVSQGDHFHLPIPEVRRFTPVNLGLDADPNQAANFRPVSDDAPLYLQIRWREHAPVRLDGAYLSAQSPSVQVFWPGPAPVSIPMATTLLPRAGDAGQFSIQASEASITGQRSWTWHGEAAAIGTPNGGRPVGRFDPIAFSAVNVGETQQENVRAFLAGVLLGVAGGAVMTLIAELVKIRRIRRTDTPPEE